MEDYRRQIIAPLGELPFEHKGISAVHWSLAPCISFASLWSSRNYLVMKGKHEDCTFLSNSLNFSFCARRATHKGECKTGPSILIFRPSTTLAGIKSAFCKQTKRFSLSGVCESMNVCRPSVRWYMEQQHMVPRFFSPSAMFVFTWRLRAAA